MTIDVSKPGPARTHSVRGDQSLPAYPWTDQKEFAFPIPEQSCPIH